MKKADVLHNGKRLFSCQIYDTFFSRLRGLMFRKPLERDEGIILKFDSEQRIDLHMLFVFFPIDMIWIRDGKIVKIERNVKPFKPFIQGEMADSIIEIRAGNARNLRIGEKLIF